MGAVDELRKLLQDVVTPDLKALEARVVALEKGIDHRFTALDKKIDMRVDALEQKIDLKIDALDRKLDMKVDALDKKIDVKHDMVMQEIRNLSAAMLAGFAHMESNINLERRIERIENERAQAPRLERTA